MGIRELAAAAKVAEEAAAKAEKKRLWALNARRGEQTVLRFLGVEGTATRAANGEEKMDGDMTVVQLEDDIFVKVSIKHTYGRHYNYGPLEVTAKEAVLNLCDAAGITRGHGTGFTTLAELGDAITQAEAYEVERAERAAFREAQRASA